jgi:hypothetical protein
VESSRSKVRLATKCMGGRDDRQLNWPDHGNPEVIDSSVGLVPLNALVFTEPISTPGWFEVGRKRGSGKLANHSCAVIKT